jgi:hypothetical protein
LAQVSAKSDDQVGRKRGDEGSKNIKRWWTMRVLSQPTIFKINKSLSQALSWIRVPWKSAAEGLD